MGYSTDLKWRKGITDSGDEYDAIQTAIRANHLAIVPVARGGSQLRIGDISNEGDTCMKVLIDGQSIDFADELAAKHVQAHITKLHGAAADLQGKLDKAEADKEEAEEKAIRAEKDAKDAKLASDAATGKVAALEKQLADEQAKSKPEALDAAVKARGAVIDKAANLVTDTKTFEGKTVEDIRRLAVTAKLGDAAKDMSDAAIEGAFSALAASFKPSSIGLNKLTDALSRPGFTQAGSTELRDAALAERDKYLTNAWKTHPASTQQ
jgi:hypothetical protein